MWTLQGAGQNCSGTPSLEEEEEEEEEEGGGTLHSTKSHNPNTGVGRIYFNF
jgi:hypothetical protein